jgi:hypothetical protein
VVTGAPTAAQQARLDRLTELTNIPEEFLLTDMGYATFGLRDLQHSPDGLNGRTGVSNIDVTYTDPEIDAAIERVEADPFARLFLFNNYTPSGDVGDTRIVSLHTDKDGLVAVENASSLMAVVPVDRLTSAVAVEDTPSHCGFSAGELVAGWESLRDWVSGLPQPTPETLQSACEDLVADGLQAGPCRIDDSFVIPEYDEHHPSRAEPIGDGASLECVADDHTLCLNDERFRVRMEWATGTGDRGPATLVPLTDDTGYAWFFNPANVEAVIKVLDACGLADRFWTFAGGLTNVEVNVEVTDTSTGAFRRYQNPQQTPFQPIQDTAAFATCDGLLAGLGRQPVWLEASTEGKSGAHALPRDAWSPIPSAPRSAGAVVADRLWLPEAELELPGPAALVDSSDWSLLRQPIAALGSPVGSTYDAITLIGANTDADPAIEISISAFGVVTFDGQGSNLIPQFGNVMARVTESFSTQPDGTLNLQIAFQATAGELFPGGLEINGIPLTYGGVGIGLLGDRLDWEPEHVVIAAIVETYVGSTLRSSDDVTSLFGAPNPWPGIAGLIGNGLAGQGIDRLSLRLRLTQGAVGEPPATPSNLTGTVLSSSSVRLDWQDNADNETGFRIERRLGGGSFSDIGQAVPPDATQLQIGSLQPGTTYTFRVRAINEIGNSGYSNLVTLTTSVVEVPTDLTAVAESATEVLLTWLDNASNELSFEIEGKTFGGSFEPIATADADATSFLVSDLVPATYYTFRVRATAAGGTSPYSNEASATTNGLGLECVEDEETLCLNDGRFRVVVAWGSEQSGVGHAVPLSGDTGYFWFFSATNVELIVKALDACVISNRFWVFAGGLTDVETILTVEDTESAEARTYINPATTPFQPLQDTAAFATCP